jgi:hypothetical protein
MKAASAAPSPVVAPPAAEVEQKVLKLERLRAQVEDLEAEIKTATKQHGAEEQTKTGLPRWRLTAGSRVVVVTTGQRGAPFLGDKALEIVSRDNYRENGVYQRVTVRVVDREKLEAAKALKLVRADDWDACFGPPPKPYESLIIEQSA